MFPPLKIDKIDRPDYIPQIGFVKRKAFYNTNTGDGGGLGALSSSKYCILRV